MKQLILICLPLALLFSSCSGSANANSDSTASAASDRSQAQQGGGIAAAPTPVRSPLATPSAAPSPDEANTKGPADVIYAYYASINSGDYRSAYEMWSGKGEASKKTFEQFRAGFRDTETTEVTTGTIGGEDAAAGSRYVTIPVTIDARTKGGKKQSFTGEYVLRRSVVDGATPEQRSWRIYSASIRRR